MLQFPLWWYGPPGILKGWFDRVLTDQFAYGHLDPELGVPRRYGDGGLTGRRALVLVTAGEDERSIGPRGISGDLESLLFPYHPRGALVHGHRGPGSACGVRRRCPGFHKGDREVKRLRERLDSLDTETPRRFRALRNGDYRGTRALRADILPGRTDLGIHLAERP